MEEFKFVGYWNGDVINPEITFSVPEINSNKKLVLITINIVPDNKEVALKFRLNDLNSKTKKLNRGLKNLVNSTKRLK